MKVRYIVALALILLAAVLFEYVLISSPLGEHPRISNAIQAAAVFIALLASIVAIAVSDPTAKQIKVLIAPYISRNHASTHNQADLPDQIRTLFSELPEKFESNRVHFRIVNQSGFTLVNPTISFRLPRKKRHPHQVNGRYVATFNSNLFNSQDDLKTLEFGETQILSNSNLPYWNNHEELTIWVRMALGSSNFEAFDVEVSVNAENAQGITSRVRIAPGAQETGG